MNLEEIMKPYFDKKEVFDKKYIEGKRVLELRLNKIKENKEREIEEYVRYAISERPDFYAGYGAMVRKDLEQEYARKESELENEIKNYDKFYRVDVRELVSVKEDIRKELISARKNIELQLREVQLNSDIIMLKLTKFETIYDENYNVVNGDERRKLFDENHNLIEVKYNLEKQLEKIKEYLELTEITKEEASILMMSLTPWEKEEYDRRKAAIANIKEEIEEQKEVSAKEEEKNETATEEEIEEQPVQEEETVSEKLEEKDEDKNDLGGSDLPAKEPEIIRIDSEEPEIVPVEEQIEDGVTLVDSFADLINEIYDDILLAAKKTRTIAINGKNDRFLTTLDENDELYQYGGELDEDNMELPNGNYINKRDIFNALDKYRKQNKGRVFKVKGYNDTFEINRKNVRLLKKHLRECSTIKLVREKKIGHFDLKRVYGKVGAGKYIKLASDVETKMATGKYINEQELRQNLGDLFKEKSSSWFTNFRNKLNRKSKVKEFEMDNIEQNQLEWDEDYIIKTK